MREIRQEFGGILSDPQNQGSKKFGENFEAFFCEKVRASKKNRANFMLQMCHPNNLGPPNFGSLERGWIPQGVSPQ